MCPQNAAKVVIVEKCTISVQRIVVRCARTFRSAYRRLLESVSTEKISPFISDILSKARCIARVFAVNTDLNFGSDADSVQFPVVAASPVFLCSQIREACHKHWIVLFQLTH